LKLNPIASYVAARLSEPSTWAGAALVAAVFGVPPGTIDVVHQLVAAALAAGAVFLPELSAALSTATAAAAAPAAAPAQPVPVVIVPRPSIAAQVDRAPAAAPVAAAPGIDQYAA
jgi:hypothetical protein